MAAGPAAAPFVSVLVPCHDAAPWLAEALGSALGQSLGDLEVIVVDDGSRDASPAIAAELAARDPRLRAVRRPVNRGSAATRNEALDLARGRWVAVLDADDRMAPERLARLVEAGERHAADWIADDQWIEAEGLGWPPARLLLDEPAGASPLDPVRLIDCDPPETIGYGTLKPLLRRAFLERQRIRWRSEAGRSEDFALVLDCIAAGGRCWILNEPLYHYRLRPGSQVTSLGALPTLAHQVALQALAERIVAGLDEPRLAAALARRRARIEAAGCYRRTLEALRAGALGRAARTIAGEPAVLRLLARGLGEAALRRLRGNRVPTLANRRLFLETMR